MPGGHAPFLCGVPDPGSGTRTGDQEGGNTRNVALMDLSGSRGSGAGTRVDIEAHSQIRVPT